MLPIRKETLKTILLCMVTFVSYFLAISLYVQGVSMFLDTLGAENLPYAIVASSFFIILYSLFNSYLSSRFNASRIFMIGLFLMISFFALTYGLSFNFIFQVIVFYLVVDFFYNFLDTALLNFAASLVTPLQAKNVLPIISGFNSLGLILGSYFAVQFQIFHENMGLGTIPIFLLIIVLLLVFAIYKIFGKSVKTVAMKSEKKGNRKVLSESLRFIFKESRLYRTAAIVAILMVGVGQFSDFKLETTLSLHYSEEQLTQMFSTVYLIESVITFFLNFFIANKLLFRFGVGNMIIFVPVLMFVFLTVASFFGMAPFFVILYYMAYALPRYSFFPVAFNQIFQIVPKKLGQSVYYLIQGLIVAASTMVFSISLLIYSFDISLEKTLNTGVIFVIIGAFAFMAYKLRHYYGVSLKDNLFLADSYLKEHSIELLAEKANRVAGVYYLRRLFNLPHTPTNLRIKIIESLGIISNYESLSDLIRVLKSKDPKEVFAALQAIMIILKQKKINDYPITKHLLLKSLQDLFIADIPLYAKLAVIESLKFFNIEDVVKFLEQQLKNDDPQIQKNVIETLGSFNDRGIVTYIEPYLSHDNRQLVAAAVASLWKFDDLRPYLISRVSLLLSAVQGEEVENALYLIGMVGAIWEKKYVESQVKSSNPRNRIHALFIYVKLWPENKLLDRLIEEWILLVKRGDSEEIEFSISQYVKLKQKTKEVLMKKVRILDPHDVELFLQALIDSRYILTYETEALS